MMDMTTLLYIAVLTPLIAFTWSNKRAQQLMIASLLIFSGLAVHWGYTKQYKQLVLNGNNFYDLLHVTRTESAMSIRRAYRRESMTHHPDARVSDGSGFERLQEAYAVLVDEDLRDIYNRFGEDVATTGIALDAKAAHIDPRKDELKLIADIVTRFLLWFVVSYVLTIPASFRSARTWHIFLLIALFVLEVMFRVSEASLSSQLLLWVNQSITEHEVIETGHALVPPLFLLLCAVARYFYFDVDLQCFYILGNVAYQQQTINEALGQLAVSIDHINSNDGANSSEDERTKCRERLVELQTRVRHSQAAVTTNMQVLRDSNSNSFAQYHWLLFVLMYVCIYLFN